MHALVLSLALLVPAQNNGLGVEVASVTAKGTIRYRTMKDSDTYRIKDHAITVSDASGVMSPKGPSSRSVSKIKGFFTSPISATEFPLMQANFEADAKVFEQPDGRRIVSGKLSFETRDKKVRLYAPIIHADIPNPEGCVLTARGFHQGSPYFMQIWIQGAIKSARTQKNLFLVILTPTEKADIIAPKGSDAVLWQASMFTSECYFFSGGAHIITRTE